MPPERNTTRIIVTLRDGSIADAEDVFWAVRRHPNLRERLIRAAVHEMTAPPPPKPKDPLTDLGDAMREHAAAQREVAAAIRHKEDGVMRRFEANRVGTWDSGGRRRF